jgi:predicted PurR-regulated permease PerM
MAAARPAVFWITIAIIALVMLVLLRPILLPFAVGMALAYLLAPVVDRLERAGMNRGLVALILVLLLVVGFLGLVLVTLPALVGELRFFVEEFPRTVARVQALLADTSRPWLHRIMGQELRIEESAIHAVEAMGSAWLDDLIRSAWLGGKALFSLLSLLVVVPIVSIYLLADWNRMTATIDGWVPARHREDVRALGREIHESVAGFVRGQIVICLILAVCYAGALKLIGLNHSILIGFTAGLISFVPFLGLGIGFAVATCVAIAQFWPDWTPLVEVAAIFLIGEILSDYVLSPRIIGSRVNLNPVCLMFALFAFGYLFGFVGLLVAIPLAASLGVVLRFAMLRLLASPDPNVVPAPSASGAATSRLVASGRGEIGRFAEEIPASEHDNAVVVHPGGQPETPKDTAIT